jgi:hypothetical protein
MRFSGNNGSDSPLPKTMNPKTEQITEQIVSVRYPPKDIISLCIKPCRVLDFGPGIPWEFLLREGKSCRKLIGRKNRNIRNFPQKNRHILHCGFSNQEVH